MEDKAEEYRKRAQEADERADDAKDLAAQRTWREVAASCRELAGHAERKTKKND